MYELLKKYYRDKFVKIQRDEKIKKYLSVLFLILFISISLISLSSISSVIDIISTMKLPSGYINVNLNYLEPENLSFVMPYEIHNHGVFNLEDISLGIRMKIKYINETNGVNVSRLIFRKTSFLKDCKPFSINRGFFEGDMNDFNITALEIVDSEADSNILFNLTISYAFKAVYSLGLIHLTIMQDGVELI